MTEIQKREDRMDRESRLPKWAQDELRQLRQWCAAYKAERDLLCSKQPTRVMWGWDFQDHQFGYLPEQEDIAFQMQGDHRPRLRVRPSRDFTELKISAECGLMTVHESANCFSVRYKQD